MSDYDKASEIASRFADGQPIILNHHSTKQARRDRDRADNAMRRHITQQDKEDRQAQSAKSRQTEQKRREMVAHAPVINQTDVAKGDIVWVRPGRGTQPIPHRVAKVNQKSVSVETGFSWTDRVPYEQIVRVDALETMPS